jgi:hypothetical protein
VGEIKPAPKITIGNTIFFGVIGSLIGGIIPFILYAGLAGDRDSFFVTYIFVSIYRIYYCINNRALLQQSYIKKLKRYGVVTFGEELTLGFKSALLAMLSLTLTIELVLLALGYSDGSTKTQLINFITDSAALFVMLIIVGLISGCACANLVREWIQKNLVCPT